MSAEDLKEHLQAMIANDRSYYAPQDPAEVGA